MIKTKYVVAGFLVIFFEVLAFNAFIANSFLFDKSSGSIINMLVEVYGWLLTNIGPNPTGAVFAACGIVLLILAIMDGRSAKAAKAV